MTLVEFVNNIEKYSISQKTSKFNELTIEDRKLFLNALDNNDYNKFIKDIRTQAVKDFWTREREAVINGENTRGWTPEQIEKIMNFSDKTGNVLFGKVENHKKGWIICKMLNLL